MTADLSTVDSRQLEAWAYGRQSADVDRARAYDAQRELLRRAEVPRADRARVEAAATLATLASTANDTADDTAVDTQGALESASEHPDPMLASNERRRRRMLRTGIAGVAAAALALGAGVAVLNQPNPDPWSVFDRAETEADRVWAERLVGVGLSGGYVEGPRAVELGDGIVAIVTRVSTVPDGRSTEWDSVCLAVGSTIRDEPTGSLGLSCTYLERFEREGLSAAERPSATGGGYDTISWSPSGGPQLEPNVPLEALAGSVSVLDYMAFPAFVEPPTDALATIAQPERLVMGPAALPIASNDRDTPTVDVFTYLLQGETETAGPVFCALGVTGTEPQTTACAPLSIVRRQGLAFTVVSDARAWVVTIAADGPDRRDTLRLAD